MMEDKRMIITTNEDRCVGCNKCIRYCPVFDGNIVYTVDDQIKVKVNSNKCIHCGKCIEVCDHEARDFIDDTERFFSDIASGKKISVIAAPAIRTNFSHYKKLLGYLKTIGIHVIYDVSFGADITTWAYLKTIESKNISSMIAQPCPSVVRYIENHQPAMIDQLAPIQSPMMCTAIYLKKYMNIDDDIAFLSPCIGKISEIRDKNTFSYVSYNVTYKKLMDYLKKHKIDLSTYKEQDFEDIGCALGCVFSRPGGLKENVEARIKNPWIRQIEGQNHAYDYLKEYEKRIQKEKAVPLLVDK
jgi:iron only hydrogenase large subunit-like protein